MSVISLLIVVAVLAIVHYATGAVLASAAPSVGYVSEPDRDHWRRFGWNWGVFALAYFAVARVVHGPRDLRANPHPLSYGPADTVVASRAARFGAQIVDGLVVVVPLYVLALILGHAAPLLVGIAVLVAYVLYAPALLSRKGESNGQTIGKQLLGLRVVRRDGAPVTFGSGLLRELLGRSILSWVTLGIYGLVDSAWCLWDPRKQTLHDKVASTVVVSAS